MKRVFIAFMYAPKATGKTGGNQSTTPQNENEANENKGETSNEGGEGEKSGEGEGEGDKKPEAPAEPTSEALIEIRAKIDDALTSLATITDRKAKLDVVLNLQKLQAQETSEIANIKKALLDAKLQEARSAKIALINDAIETAIVARSNAFNETIPLEERQAQSDAAKMAFDKLATELVGGVKVSASKPSSTGGTSTGGKTKSEQIEDMIRSGNTYDEMIAAGMGDGTIRTVAGNIKFRKLANGQYAPRD